jgi:hypothetical protein
MTLDRYVNIDNDQTPAGVRWRVGHWGEKLYVYAGGMLVTLDGEQRDRFASAVARAAALAASGPCEAVTAKRGTVCGDPAGRRSGVCKCGHPRGGMLCEYHLTGGEPLWCRVCYLLNGPESHQCTVVFNPVAERAEAAPAAGTEN